MSTDESSAAEPSASSGDAAAKALDVEHRRDANRAIVISALGLALTGGIELALAFVTNSVGLLSDALHNLADVSTSIVVFIGFRVSKKAPTDRYPYGLNRAEDLAGLGVALVIWISAGIAAYESWRKLVHHGLTTHLGLGMLGAVIGIVGNQVVAWYKGRVGRRIHSATLVADAKHSWLDALSSVGALVGLIAVALGYWWGDPIAGFAVTLFIVHVGYEVTTEIGHRLLDGIDPELVAQAAHIAESVPGVDHAKALGRWSGRSLTFDIDAYLDRNLSVSEAHDIARHITLNVKDQIDQAHHVRVSVLPTPAPARDA
jgi:cation diffusion facilitator family transporter